MYFVRQSYFEIICAILLLLKKNLKAASKCLMVASAEIHSAEFGLWTIKLKVFLAHPHI